MKFMHTFCQVVKCAVAVVAVSSSWSARAATVTNRWTGAAGTVDWNDGSKWSAGVPTSDQVVLFDGSKDAAAGVVDVAPPDSFAGKIVVAGSLGRQYQYEHSTYACFSTGENAQWTVAGDGVVIASDGVASRISAEFNGAVSIPGDVVFVPTASMSESVRYIGTGRLDLRSANGDIESSIAGFHGTAMLPTNVNVSRVAVMQNATLELGNGGTVSVPEHTLAYGGTVRIPDWTETGAWSFNGTTYAESPFASHPFNALPPSVNADGSLKLTDDPAQVHSVIYKGHAFSKTEDWGVEFTYEPSLPAEKDYFGPGTEKNHLFGGRFGFVLQAIGPECVGTAFDNPLPGQTGFAIYHYNGQIELRYQGDFNTHYYIPTKQGLGGLSFAEPLRVKVTCVEDEMTMTLVQGDKSFAFRKSLQALKTGAYYIGFVGASDSNGATKTDPGNVYWVQETVRDFKGWYHSRSAGGWREVAAASDYSTFDESTWFMRQIDQCQTPAVTNDGNACVSADGSLVLNASDGSGCYSGRAISTKNLSRNSRYLLSFDLDYGQSGSSRGNGWTFGFCKRPSTNGTFNKYGGSYEFDCGVDANWDYGAHWKHDPYNQRVVASCLASQSFGNKTSTSDSFVTVADGQKGRYAAFYDPIDGFQGLDVSVVASAPAAKSSGTSGRFDYAWTSDQLETYRNTKGDGESFCIHFRTGSKSTPYQHLTLRNVKVKALADNSDANLASRVSVAANAVSSFRAGPSVNGSQTPVVSLGGVALASGARLNLDLETSAALPSAPSGIIGVGSLSVSDGSVLAAGTGVTAALPDVVTCVGGPASALSVSGAVRFGSTLRIVVPRDWQASRAKIRLLDLSSATVVGSLPMVSVVDENGVPFDDRYAVDVGAQGVSIDFQRGFVLIFR